MKRTFIRKTSYRFLALFLAAVTLAANSVTVSFAIGDKAAEPLCNIEEHAHDDFCYMTQLVLNCGLEADMSHEHVGTCYLYEENALLCGKEAVPGHAHGDDCYHEVAVNICGKEEAEAHTHGDVCYTETKSITCGQAETEGHTHDSGCYSSDAVLVCSDASEEHQHGDGCWDYPFICTLPESEDHTHSAGCEETVRTLVCSLAETEGHSHTVECEGTEKTLVCTLPETEAHEHSEACRGMKETLICGTHVHGDECYVEEKVLICEETEHVHGEECWPKKEEETEEKPEEAEGPEQRVSISGELPEGASVSSIALDEAAVGELIAFAKNEQLLFAYDISISLAEGGEYQPKDEGKSVMVTVDAPVTLVDGQHIVVYHVDGESNIEEKPCTDNGDGTVSFEADSFSVYIGSVVTDSSVYLTPGVGYNFYNTAGNNLVHSYVVWTAGLTIKVKPDLGYTINSVSVKEGEEESGAATVTEDDGVYTITFDNPTKNQIIVVEAEKNAAPAGDFIYFDLAAGNITIEGNTYSGYRYNESGTATLVSGTLGDGQSYYVYQSGNVKVAQDIDTIPVLPTHNRAPHPTNSSLTWADYVKDNNDVNEVISAWKTYYESQKNDPNGRTYTSNWISVTGSVNATIVVDSLWSNKHEQNTSRTSGGISFNPGSISGSNLTLYFIGDNRFGNIHYYSEKFTGTVASENVVASNHLTIDGDPDSTLTVTNFNPDAEVSGAKNINYWNSAIGGSDSKDDSMGIVINGGNIYAGTTPKDDCTAIGGGGNGFGVVTINGGTVTAVSTSSGAAIGGGIGKNDVGGSALVTINGGLVYAYNFSSPITSGTSTYTAYSGNVHAIPAAAIGGGSSGKNSGNAFTKVIITGGEVHAQAVGGTAIGGGSSGDIKGGDAIVTISGGTVYAKSVSGQVKDKDGNEHDLNAGAAIGGGTGGYAGGTATGGADGKGGQGGSATVTITGGTVYTGSIGGGTTNNPVGRAGFARVRIDGGTVYGQVIMGEVGDRETACTFDMTGGVLSNTQTFVPAGHEAYSAAAYNYKYPNGGAVYMDDSIGEATIDNGTITGCSGVLGGAVYMTAGKFVMNGGTISNSVATENGGAVYIGTKTIVTETEVNGEPVTETKKYRGEFTMTGGTITRNTATGNGGGIYLDGGNAVIKGNHAGAGGLITNNNAVNGGGAYLNAGNLTISEYGAINSNTASVDGGGAYLNDGNLKILDNASLSSNTAGQRGGGAFVNNGNIVMNGGQVNSNIATAGDGGGMYVSAKTKPVYVDVYSGSVSNNRSPNGTGGAFAVVGDTLNPQKIDVNIGVNENHFSSGTLHEFDHEGVHEPDIYYTHSSCPVVSGNFSGEIGGAIYISGTTASGIETSLNIFCVTANNNSSTNNLSDFMRVDGGKVLIASASERPDGISSENDRYHGNAVITDSLHVVGGQVDLYGNMENPSFDNSTLEPDSPPNSITVDVPEGSGDYFKDHRYAEPEGYYKLLYYANYDDGDIASIKYKSYQMKYDSEHTIMPALYVRSGYEITGWNTEPDGSGTTYGVSTPWIMNDELPGADIENNELVLYAQWKINGYTVRYERNSPNSSLPYGGDMGDPQPFTYNVDQNLKPNAYWVEGYRFTGWNTRANGDGESFSDGQLIDENLSETNGAEIVLYAQWVVCDHTNTFVYRAENGSHESKIYRDCECRAYTEQVAVLSAENCIYNGAENPASVTPAMVISYFVLDTATGTFGPLVGVPVNAGTYRASVTIGGATAEVTYTISKATQPAPSSVTFSVSTGVLTAQTNPATGKAGTSPEYRLVYIQNGIEYTIDSSSWDGPNVTLPTAYTSYRVYAVYPGNENYYDSDEVGAQEVYFYGSEESGTTIIIVADTGIAYTGAGDAEDGGFRVTAAAEAGYYLSNSFAITVDDVNVQMGPDEDPAEDAYSYLFTSIPPRSTITITISGVKQAVSITAIVQEGEVFGSVEHDPSANISPDSAFTASYEVTGFDTAEYEDLDLQFHDVLNAPVSIPAGTSVIMKELGTGSENYWYYIFSDAGSEVSITSFRNMETGEDFPIDSEAYTLQFIIDFSGSAGAKFASLNTSLVAVKKAGSAAPDVQAGVNIGLGDVAFSLSANEEASGLMNKLFTCSYSGDVAASKWRGRAAAIVLERDNSAPVASKPLPADAVIVANIGGKKINYRPDPDGSFKIPIGVLTSTVDVELTLQSAMFPDQDIGYIYTAKLYVSNSLVASAPMNGELCGQLDVLKFEHTVSAVPSISITSDKNVVNLKEETNISLLIETKEMNNCTVRGSVQQQTDNGYIDGAHYLENVTAGQLVIELSGYASMPGNYRVLFTVSDGIKTIMEVPYYFIIQN